jgi:hypothetical protein
MGDGASQSAITRKLNRLAGRRIRGAWSDALRAQVLSLLQNTGLGPPMGSAVGTDLDGITVAARAHEQEHVGEWPVLQQAVVRDTIVFAIDNNIQTVYDWEPRPGEPVSTSIKMSPELICVTFKSPPT